jgi:hypothetical protein
VSSEHQPGEPGSDPGLEGAAAHIEASWSARLARFVRAVREGDETTAQEIILRLSQRSRALAPLAFAVGGLTMLFTGLKLLFSNWRLTLVQVLPAVWITLATLDLKAHVLHGKSVHVLRGPVLIPIALAITAVTAASFFLNAVFGFAIIQTGAPKIRPAVTEARSHLATILGWGAGVGLMLAGATTVATRWGHPWFGISLGVVIGVMMVCYVAVPSRLIGVKPTHSRREKLTASAVSGAVGAVVCTPPYLLARLGILMLSTRALVIPGIVFIAFGATLSAVATSAVKAVKMGTKLAAPPPIPHPGNLPVDRSAEGE